MQRRIERPLTGDQLTAYRANLLVTLLVLVGAGLNGGSYLNYHEDFSSMIMSAGFAVAVVSYLLGLYFLPRNPTSPASRQMGLFTL